jgi:hypothetical protein
MKFIWSFLFAIFIYINFNINIFAKEIKKLSNDLLFNSSNIPINDHWNNSNLKNSTVDLIKIDNEKKDFLNFSKNFNQSINKRLKYNLKNRNKLNISKNCKLFEYKLKKNIADSEKNISIIIINTNDKIKINEVKNKEQIKKVEEDKKDIIYHRIKQEQNQDDDLEDSDNNNIIDNLNILSGFDPNYLFKEDDNDLDNIDKKNVGYLGYCLVKYKNHFINLHKIKDIGGDFFLKYKDKIIEFSICRDIYTFDENKYGLFVDRVNNILFAGNKDKEKIFSFIDDDNMISNNEKKKENYQENKIIDKNQDYNKLNRNNVTPLLLNKNEIKINNYYYNKTNTDKNLNDDIKFDDINNMPFNLNMRKEKLSNNNLKNLKRDAILKRKIKIENQLKDEKLLNENKKLFNKIQLYLPLGDVCHKDELNNKEYRYSIMYELICDEKAHSPMIENRENFSPVNCFNKILIKTKYVCPSKLKKFIPWYERFNINKQFLSSIFILFGSYLLFFGRINMQYSFFFSIVFLTYLFSCSLNLLNGELNTINISKKILNKIINKKIILCFINLI